MGTCLIAPIIDAQICNRHVKELKIKAPHLKAYDSQDTVDTYALALTNGTHCLQKHVRNILPTQHVTCKPGISKQIPNLKKRQILKDCTLHTAEMWTLSINQYARFGILESCRQGFEALKLLKL